MRRSDWYIGAVSMTEPLTTELKKVLVGWFNPVKYNLERWAYALQRISGIAVTAYFLAHIVETGNVVGGLDVWSVPSTDFARDMWTATFRFLDNPFFDTGLVVIGFMLAYHTINGIRLTLAEFGFLQGRPGRPDFPYEPKSFSKAQRALFWLSVLFAVATAIYALNVFFGVNP
jgi:succinate dehydrogenase / fumarate reductase cytochrome b subunit